MKLAIAFLVVALCSSLGSGNPVAREKRDTGNVKYTYYETQGKGDYSGGNGGNQVQQPQYSKEQAQLFAFIFQGMACLFNAVQKGPAENKPSSYKFICENTIRFVETTAASCGMSSSDQLFTDPAALQMYMKLKDIVRSGDYNNIGHVEEVFGGVLGGLAKGICGILQGVGIAAGQLLGLVTGLLGGLGLDFLGGLTNAISGLAGGLLNTVGGVVGGVGNLVGGLTGGLLGGGKGGGLLGGLLGGGGGGGAGGGGGLVGGLLGGGGGGGAGGGGGLVGGLLGGGGGGGAGGGGGGGLLGGLLG